MAHQPHRGVTGDPADAARRLAALSRFAGLLRTGSGGADWCGFFQDHPDALAASLTMRLAGSFERRVARLPEADYVFYGRPAGEGGLPGCIELSREDGEAAGVYFAGPDAGGLQAVARGRFLNSEDFHLAGGPRHAFLFVGLSSTLTRRCRDELAWGAVQADAPGQFAPCPAQRPEAFLAALAAPWLHLVLVSRPGPGPDRADGRDRLTAREFQVAHEFLRVLLAAYAREVSARTASPEQAARRLAVRLHEVAYKCADSQAALTIAAALAADRPAWQEPLAGYGRIVERLAELPAKLLQPPAQAAEALSAAADELAGLLADAERATRLLPG